MRAGRMARRTNRTGSPLSLRERVRVREKAQHCPTPATPAVTGLPPFNLSAMTQPKERLLTVQRGRWCGLFIAERRKDFRTSRQEVGASEGPRQGRRAAEILKTRRHRAAAMKGASSPGSRGAAYGAPLSVAPADGLKLPVRSGERNHLSSHSAAPANETFPAVIPPLRRTKPSPQSLRRTGEQSLLRSHSAAPANKAFPAVTPPHRRTNSSPQSLRCTGEQSLLCSHSTAPANKALSAVTPLHRRTKPSPQSSRCTGERNLPTVSPPHWRTKFSQRSPHGLFAPFHPNQGRENKQGFTQSAVR